MDRKKLAIAVTEAKRFIERAEALPEPVNHAVGDFRYIKDSYPKQTGAIRRSSMDLTRALADLRKYEE